MRPLMEIRWILLAILLWLWPVEQPSEQELIAYGREQERNPPNPLKNPAYIEMIRTQHIQAVNAATARELQRHLDERKNAHYEPPEKHTDAISQEQIDKAIKFHAIHLQRIQTEEMRVTFPMRDTDKWLVT